MSGDQFARAKEIFVAACSRPSATRSDFVRTQCGDDDALLAEVESLLGFHREASQEERAAAAETHEIFAGRYRIVSELGRGGMGSVYAAHDLLLGEPVALKLLPELDERLTEALLNEVRTARRVTHPHVCRVFDYGEWEGRHYLTMELVDGEDLGSLLKRIGRLPRDKAIELAHQICFGLAAAHGEGILHRDLKPANVMIDGRGQAKIMDFGIAARLGERQPIAGTPAYMAPEQLSSDALDQRGDLYALGLVLFEMVTGEPYYEEDSTSPLERRRRPPSRATSELLGPELERILERCLDEEPAARPETALEVAAALPGGVRLQALVAAGQTPSPADLEAAGRQLEEALSGRSLWLVAMAALLLALPFLADAGLPERESWAARDPALLVERARTLVAAVSEGAAGSGAAPSPPFDEAWGFDNGLGYYADGVFWYRQSADWLLPSAVDSVLLEARVLYDDPPQSEPGMARVELASDARLVSLDIQPLELPSESSGPEEGTEADHSFLRLAGYEPQELVPVAPLDLPPVYADRRVAWSLMDGEWRRRLELATLAGQPVYFLNHPASEAESEALLLEERIWHWSGVGSQLLWLVLALGAWRWAQRNRARGRGDVPGASRIAVALIALGGATWVLSSDFVPDLEAQSMRVLAATGWLLLQAGVVWLVYLAIEPFVRRTWPQSLLSWSLLLRGRLASPLIGRDLLVGSVAGTLWACLAQLDHVLTRLFGLTPLAPQYLAWQLDVALRLRSVLSNVLASVADALHEGLMALFLLAALQRLQSRRWVAPLLFVVTLGALETAEGSHPLVSWATLGLGVAGLAVLLLLRWGVLALIVGESVFFFLRTSPLTADLGAWFAEHGVVALVTVLALGTLGWRLAGRDSQRGR